MPRRSLTDDPVENALARLEEVARAVAAGHEARGLADVPAILVTLRAEAPPAPARSLLSALDRALAGDDPAARRKFFHATRAYVSLHRGWLRDRSAA